jgi:hypothetical protein
MPLNAVLSAVLSPEIAGQIQQNSHEVCVQMNQYVPVSTSSYWYIRVHVLSYTVNVIDCHGKYVLVCTHTYFLKNSLPVCTHCTGMYQYVKTKATRYHLEPQGQYHVTCKQSLWAFLVHPVINPRASVTIVGNGTSTAGP